MAGTFALDLQKFVEKTKGKANDVVGNIIVRVAAEIDQRSPVGDPSKWDKSFVVAATALGWIGPGYVGGRFRANWQLGVDRVPAKVIDWVDPTGETTQGMIAGSIPDEAAGKVYSLVNNLPYAQALEDGYSKQAPSGMVGLTAIMFTKIVDDAVKALPA